MASLYRKAGTSNYYCSYLGRDGKTRINRSTQESKRSAAMGKALEWEEEEQRIFAAESEVGVGILDLVADAGELAQKQRLTVDRAREIVSQMLELSTGDRLNAYTISGWLDEWLLGKKDTVGEATYIAYKTAVTQFKNALGDRGSLPLEHLNETDIRKFRDAQKKSGMVSKTCNLRIKILSGALRKAAQQGLISRNPAASLEMLDEADSTKRLPFTIKEIKSIIDVAPDDWRGMILLGLYCGMRIRDASDLKWSDVDLDAKTITFTPKKTSPRRRVLVVPIHPTLEAYLRGRVETETPVSEDFLFPDLAGVGTGGRKGLSIKFVNLMKLAGVEKEVSEQDGDESERLGKFFRQRSFHSLRHSGTSIMANAGVAPELRKKISGHTTDSAHEVYTHLEVESLRPAINKIPALEAIEEDER